MCKSGLRIANKKSLDGKLTPLPSVTEGGLHFFVGIVDGPVGIKTYPIRNSKNFKLYICKS